MQSARLVLLLATLALACGASPPGRGHGSSITLAEADGDEDARAGAAPRASCALSPPRIEARSLHAVIDLGDHAGKSWLMARRDRSSPTALLVHLDAGGRLVETELTAFTEHVAFEPPARLHFLDYGPTSRWWSVDVSTPDAPQAGPPAAAGQIAWGESSAVKAFAVSGSRAFVSIYRVHYSDQGTTRLGETALYDRATGQRLGPVHPMTAWAAECLGTRCAALASSNDGDDSAELVVLEGNTPKKTRLGSFGCAGVPHWRDGDRWLLGFGEGERLRVLSVDLRSGRVRETSTRSPASECGPMHSVRLAGRAGLLMAGGRFVPISNEPRIGAAETLPELSGRSQDLAPLPDGAALADFSADHGMRHGPTDARGMRRYHREWSFTGRAGLVLRSRGSWMLRGAAPLPGSGSEGRHSYGLGVTLLSNGNHSAAIVSGEEPARLVHLSRPCE